uniref:primosomal replication protein n=1 Tax=Thaumasiovibrio occultus TaxID=1891184 RepID=UPI000B3551C6|nr:primosomal replication protein [Thaumasiovibrio occultus]
MNTLRFHQHLDQLEQQARQLDQERGDQRKPLFDEGLFSGQPKNVEPCVHQARHHLEQIEQLIATEAADPERLGYLCELITLQIHALQRELATVAIRAKEPVVKPKFQQTIEQLYQSLSQHMEWERRLVAMRDDALVRLERAFGEQRQQGQREVLALEGRIERCRAAKLKLEKKIQFQEKNS